MIFHPSHNPASNHPLAPGIPSAPKYRRLRAHHRLEMSEEILSIWLLNEQVSARAQGENKRPDKLVILHFPKVAKTARPIQYGVELILRAQPAQIQYAESPSQSGCPKSPASSTDEGPPQVASRHDAARPGQVKGHATRSARSVQDCVFAPKMHCLADEVCFPLAHVVGGEPKRILHRFKPVRHCKLSVANARAHGPSVSEVP